MSTPLDGFRDFAPLLLIPSREHGIVHFTPLLPSQEYLLSEFERGLAEGVHDFTVLKGGRQTAVGGSTLMDAITLYYMQRHSGMVGMMVSDDEDNRDYRRDVMISMLDSLPKAFRQPVRKDNAKMLAWLDNRSASYFGSRLLFAQAGIRKDANLGRSKGINFNYNDEFGFWVQTRAYAALRASRAETHPVRFYVDISTANGIGSLMHNEWQIAERAVTRRAIFVACWRNQETVCRVERSDRAVWDRYGEPDLSEQERQWTEEVERRYGVTLTREFFAWWRLKLAESFGGDEAFMCQEYAILPEEAFQAFGDKFIPRHIISRVRREALTAPTPIGRSFIFGEHMESMRSMLDDPATAPLVIWEEPDPQGVYIVGGHPWGSSGPNARKFVAQVWRAWPDKIRQVAEFATDSMEMHHFAWVVMALAGIYRTQYPADIVLEVGGSGMHVLAETERIRDFGYGLHPQAFQYRDRFADMFGAIRHYVYKRPDSFSSRALKQIRATWQVRATLFYGLRSELERGHVEVRSGWLIDQLAMLRRGEEEDADQIGGGAGQDDSAAFTAAIVTHMWLEMTRADLEGMIAPSERQPGQATHVGEDLVGMWLKKLQLGL